MKKHFGFLALLLLLIGNLSFAQDYAQIESFAGYWKFSVGDNPAWANENWDDSDWDRIKVPASWESQGYDDYNGYAWYRKTFEWDNFDDIASPIYLLLGSIDDADEAYLNGKLIGKKGSFPPNFATGWAHLRAYRIPKELLKSKGKNTIAVRVYDYNEGGGIRNGKVGIYTDYDYRYVDLPLTGKWKFKPGHNRDWSKMKYNDLNWEEIYVPDVWENQGYEDLDGQACYRKIFSMKEKPDDDLYLVLGRIDDYDQVYINGEFIASNKDLKDTYGRIYNNQYYNTVRVYQIPDDLLRQGKNQITVFVNDPHGLGGIYSGPVGITSEYDAAKIIRKYKRDRNVFESIIESFFD